MRFLALSILFASLVGCAGAQRDRIIYQRYAGHNYCHTKVETSANDPYRPGDREIVDFYGPCDAFE